ncbi:hypothetical protein Atai01_26560 [Amycolatopsis taiwanensis]|uniref:Uncharacterized protein n=1 Tax=Amycolatopsis taiwanensis TaxID=342230 RepID=A0A9W6VG09_9PSEU|nr:hypothetical protein Atai01_26560 [Amycolatopsis taiwanensis]
MSRQAPQTASSSGSRNGRRCTGGATTDTTSSWRDAVEEVADEGDEEVVGNGLVGDEQAVVRRAPELVDDHLDIDVGADLGGPQAFAIWGVQ